MPAMSLPAMRRDVKGKGEVVIVLAMTGLILACFSFIALKLYFKHMGIQPGVTFLGYDLSGMKASDAASKISQVVDYAYADPVYLKFQKYLWLLRYNKHFRLQVDTTKLALDATKIGEKKTVYQQLYDWVTLNYPRTELSDKKALETPFSPILDRKFTQTNVAGRLARIAVDKVYARPLPSGQVELTMESRVTSLDAILDALEASFKQVPMSDRRVVEIAPVAQPSPQGTTRKIVDLFDPKHGFTVVVQSKTSTVESADPSTFDNIVIACQKINGTMVNPGEIFSFNRVVGERTVRAGFKQAASSAVVGIGVGQVSSTMYEPLLRAGVNVVERHPHSHWYPELKFTSPGLDAAVTDVGWDLRFTNDSPLPLLLMAYLKNAKLTFEIRSVQEPPYRIDIHMGRIAKVPFKTDWRFDKSMAHGQRVLTPGLDGIGVRVYRTFLTREEGRKIREDKISDNQYAARSAVIQVPPDFKPPPDPKPEPAPRSGDEPSIGDPQPLPRAHDDDDDEPPAHAAQERHRTAPTADDDADDDGAPTPAPRHMGNDAEEDT